MLERVDAEDSSWFQVGLVDIEARAVDVQHAVAAQKTQLGGDDLLLMFQHGDVQSLPIQERLSGVVNEVTKLWGCEAARFAHFIPALLMHLDQGIDPLTGLLMVLGRPLLN